MTDRFAGFGLARARHDVPLLWRRDERFKTFRFELHMCRPLDRRAAQRSLLPSLLLQGTVGSPDRPAIARRMEELYGSAVYPASYTRGASHVLRLALDTVSGAFLPGEPDQMGLGLSFLAEQIGRPLLDETGDAFPAATFELERREALDALRALVDDKGAWARLRAMEFACEGEAIGIPEHGSIEEIERMTADAPETARRDFLRHGRMHAIAVGAVPDDEGQLLAALDDFFESLPEPAPEPVAPAPALAKRESRTLFETSQGAQQAKLVMVFRLPPMPSGADAAAAHAGRRAFDQIFGGGPQSRLFREVREKRSLAYYAQSGLDRHTNLLSVHVGCEPDKIDAVREEVGKQIGELAAGGAQPADLAAAQATLTARLTRIDDALGSMAAFAGDQWIHGDDRTPQGFADALAATTLDAVREAAAQTWLDATYVLSPGEENNA